MVCHNYNMEGYNIPQLLQTLKVIIIILNSPVNDLNVGIYTEGLILAVCG